MLLWLQRMPASCGPVFSERLAAAKPPTNKK